MGPKLGSGSNRQVTVAGLAKELGVSPAWLVKLCVEEKVPGIANTTSALSPDWHLWVRDRALRQPEVAMPQQVDRDSSPRWSVGGSARNGRKCSREQAVHDVPNMAATARTLIEGGQFEYAVILLFAAMKHVMERCRPEDTSANVGLIESVFVAEEEESIRNDVHRIRLMANRAKHEGLSPSRYDADHTLWVYNWLCGPQGKFSPLKQVSA